MSKKPYSGMKIAFVPIDKGNVIVTSTCPPVSEQYYITDVPGQCDNETGNPGDPIGYSENYYNDPEGWVDPTT